jgi:predicted nucleotidyltransferase
MKQEILSRLKQIEKDEDVVIFYACESGSRAWGFPSADSDYDVRFIYAHPRDWYLSIDVEDKRDVVERPINDELDISGWDVRKALKLLRKSNPPLLEWLNSPIVYIETDGALTSARSDTEQQSMAFAQKLRNAVAEFYSPISSYHHYLSMARNNHREFLRGDLVKIKKYFYVLRPLFAIRWIEDRSDPVPMEFEKLVEHSIGSNELKQAISELLERKRSGKEIDRQPKIPVISGFIDDELARLRSDPKLEDRTKPNFERLNEIFRECVADPRLPDPV